MGILVRRNDIKIEKRAANDPRTIETKSKLIAAQSVKMSEKKATGFVLMYLMSFGQKKHLLIPEGFELTSTDLRGPVEEEKNAH